MKQALPPFNQLPSRWLLAAALCALLTACGGGQGTSNSAEATRSAEAVNPFTATTPSPPSAQTTALQKQGARLNSEELARIAETGVLPEPFDGQLLSGAMPGAERGEGATAQTKSLGQTKGAASRVPVFRFFNNQTSAHFFTTSTTERNNVQATLPFMSYEGPAFYSSATTIPGLSPVHRFYNTQTGVHFYTISEAERAHVAANLAQFSHEGIAYYASTLAGTGYTPLYRFFYASKGFHFYSNSLSERDHIIATLPQYSYEGVGYYVLGSDWQTPAVPHTGITSAQCYQSNSDVLVACSSSGATSLNAQQDGHRAGINPMSYSRVGSNPTTSCVKDYVTGLIWEGKTPTGVRSGDKIYTNYADNTPGDASAYVNMVNGLNLCGFNDWRLPSSQELWGIENHGAEGGDPRVVIADFPNTWKGRYWASERTSIYASAVDFGVNGSFDDSVENSNQYAVRLVRGAEWSGSRYLITSLSYPGDGVNNAAIDRKTGLVWRRCSEGQTWSGSGCTGTATLYSHFLALVLANNTASWRLPNVKEQGSIIDTSRAYPALDNAIFPTSPGSTWSSTPGHVSDDALRVNLYEGLRREAPRTSNQKVRLVRSVP